MARVPRLMLAVVCAVVSTAAGDTPAKNTPDCLENEASVCAGRFGIGYAGKRTSLAAAIVVQGGTEQSVVRKDLRSALSFSDALNLEMSLSTSVSSVDPDETVSTVNTAVNLMRPLLAVDFVRWQLQDGPGGRTSQTTLRLSPAIEPVSEIQAVHRLLPNGGSESDLTLGLQGLVIGAEDQQGDTIRAVARMHKRAARRDGRSATLILSTEIKDRQEDPTRSFHRFSPFDRYLLRLNYDTGSEGALSMQYQRSWQLSDAGALAFTLQLQDESVAPGNAANLTWTARF